MPGTLAETIDIDCVDDLTLTMGSVSGRLAMAQSLARRLVTPRGRFSWLAADGLTVRGWPDYGTDLRGFLLSKATPQSIARAAEAECLKDERVQAVDVAVVQDTSTTLAITIAVTDADGTFTFTLSIDEAKASLVSLQEAA